MTGSQRKLRRVGLMCWERLTEGTTARARAFGTNFEHFELLQYTRILLYEEGQGGKEERCGSVY